MEANFTSIILENIIKTKLMFHNDGLFSKTNDISQFAKGLKLNFEYKRFSQEESNQFAPNKLSEKLTFQGSSIVHESKLMTIESDPTKEASLEVNPQTDGINDNLKLALYKNKNHISFKQKRHVEAKPHRKWKLYRVISGHTGWVRCVDVDPTNQW